MNTQAALTFTPMLNAALGFTGTISIVNVDGHKVIEVGAVAVYEVVVKMLFNTTDSGVLSKTS